MNALELCSPYEKLNAIEASCELALRGELSVPNLPGRNVELKKHRERRPRKGLTFKEGQGQMLHDLAHIEMQAMELGLRGLIEYPDAPKEMREQLLELTLSEARHMKMSIEALNSVGYEWGDFDLHLGLWHAVKPDDSILDRVLIVHRYLEASGLDAGDKILRRLAGVDAGPVREVLKVINEEEIGHVYFGSYWYRELCRIEKLDAQEDFAARMGRLSQTLPKRYDAINYDLRKKAGFTDAELFVVEQHRETLMKEKYSSDL